MTSDDAVSSLNLSIADWEQHRDHESIELLDAAISSELIFRRANGEIVGKRDFMDGLRGASPFVRRETELVSVDARGPDAVAIVIVTTTDDNSNRQRFRNVRVLRAFADGWQIRFWFNDRLD